MHHHHMMSHVERSKTAISHCSKLLIFYFSRIAPSTLPIEHQLHKEIYTKVEKYSSSS